LDLDYEGNVFFYFLSFVIGVSPFSAVFFSVLRDEGDTLLSPLILARLGAVSYRSMIWLLTSVKQYENHQNQTNSNAKREDLQ